MNRSFRVHASRTAASWSVKPAIDERSLAWSVDDTSALTPDLLDRSARITTAGRDYNRSGAAYDRWWAPIIAPVGRRLLDDVEALVNGPRAHLIDIGTGTGTLAVAALQRWPDCRVAGVDPAPGALAIAGKEARRK